MQPVSVGGKERGKGGRGKEASVQVERLLNMLDTLANVSQDQEHEHKLPLSRLQACSIKGAS